MFIRLRVVYTLRSKQHVRLCLELSHAAVAVVVDLHLCSASESRVGLGRFPFDIATMAPFFLFGLPACLPVTTPQPRRGARGQAAEVKLGRRQSAHTLPPELKLLQLDGNRLVSAISFPMDVFGGALCALPCVALRAWCSGEQYARPSRHRIRKECGVPVGLRPVMDAPRGCLRLRRKV